VRLDRFFLAQPGRKFVAAKNGDFNSRIVSAPCSLCVVFRESPNPFRERSFEILRLSVKTLTHLRAAARGGRAQALFGGHKAVVRPDPIPNSAVKRSLADGSSSIGSARVGCRQSFKKAGEFSPAFCISARIRF
jgi:hypothetical protein